jgi:hypothetical protein
VDINEIIATLPDPKVDKRPKAAMVDEEGARLAREQRNFMSSLMDPKVDTEERVKYVLHSLFGMHLKKDGDWKTYPNGRTVWQKKIADYYGSTPANGVNWHTYVEVKGISPGKVFSLSRLDRPNKPGQESQFDKLTRVYKRGDFVLLAIGWWLPKSGTEPVMIEQGSRKITKWKRGELDLEIDLIEWGLFMHMYPNLKRRTLARSHFSPLPPCRIFKSGNRWALEHDHWWNDLKEVVGPGGRGITVIKTL